MAVVARFVEKDGELINAFDLGKGRHSTLTRLAIDEIGDVHVAGKASGSDSVRTGD